MVCTRADRGNTVASSLLASSRRTNSAKSREVCHCINCCIFKYLHARAMCVSAASITQHTNGVELSPQQLLHHYPPQHAIPPMVAKPEYAPPLAFYTPNCSMPDPLASAGSSGLYMNSASSSAASAPPLPSDVTASDIQAPATPLHGSASALKRPQHTTSSSRNKRLKMTQRESMTSVDDDHESLQVRVLAYFLCLN